MRSRSSSCSIGSYREYRQRLGRLAEILVDDPFLDTPEAEGLLDEIAAYMVDGGPLEPGVELGGD